MKINVVFAISLVGVICLPKLAYASPLCLKNEKTFFSCNIKHKTLAFCGIESEYVEYRFGTKQKLEMKYRSSGSNSKNKIYLTHNGGAEISFNVNDFSYELIEPIRGKPFMFISKKDKIIKTLNCDGFGESDKYNLNNAGFTIQD